MNINKLLDYLGKTGKHLLMVFLILLISFSWAFSISFYKDNKAEIVLAVDDIVREIAMPYLIAQMNFLEPVDELPVPVYGVALEDIDDTWGSAREEGRTHEGTDIFADRGTPVFSSTEGYVIRLNIGTRGGKNVMVVGPGGLYYYYAHFDRVAEGIERGRYVTKDTVLGFVGNSGNAAGTPPHLHLGIYPEEWDGINPYQMLVDRWDN